VSHGLANETEATESQVDPEICKGRSILQECSSRSQICNWDFCYRRRLVREDHDVRVWGTGGLRTLHPVAIGRLGSVGGRNPTHTIRVYIKSNSKQMLPGRESAQSSCELPLNQVLCHLFSVVLSAQMQHNNYRCIDCGTAASVMCVLVRLILVPTFSMLRKYGR